MIKKSIIRIIVSVLILFIIFIIYIFIEPYWIEIKVIELEDEDIPSSFKGFRIVFLADIHHGPFFSIERVKDIVRLVNELGPDIVLLGGDYVHRSEEYIEPCFEELSRINSDNGKYGVLGNHDHWENPQITLNSMEKAGIVNLDNRSEWIINGDEKIKIGGVGDLWEDNTDIQPTISDTTENDFVILISHNPDFAEEIKNNKIDVILSGHTHGGQVTFFGLYAPFLPSRYGQKYRSGIIDTEFTKVIVSNGIGTIDPPVRFFCRPQIILLILK